MAEKSWGLDGKTLMPRVIAGAAMQYWRNYELTKAIAVSLGESAGSLGAWHDNQAMLSSCDVGQIVANPELYYKMEVVNPVTGRVKLEDGTPELRPPESMVIVSRDCGLYQINIPAAQIGEDMEQSLRTTSLDSDVYDAVRDYNIMRADALYHSPWSRPGDTPDIRLWQPWVAYTKGWATFPEWWIWHQDADGNPTGPWTKTGRYIHRAIAGQMNLHLVILKDWTEKQALYYGKRYAAHFGVTQGKLIIKNDIVQWGDIPPAPSSPPADGVGQRPIENNGV